VAASSQLQSAYNRGVNQTNGSNTKAMASSIVENIKSLSGKYKGRKQNSENWAIQKPRLRVYAIAKLFDVRHVLNSGGE
jgi:hypothetical protein